MSLEDQKNWEMEEMRKPIDLKSEHIRIDPSPFQLVEKTSILKVHGLFSMLGINHAYVTNTGRLVGVVASKEVIAPFKDDAVSLPLITLYFLPFSYVKPLMM